MAIFYHKTKKNVNKFLNKIKHMDAISGLFTNISAKMNYLASSKIVDLAMYL